MPILIEGVRYFTAGDVTEKAKVSRQTLWRWRQEGHAPSGRRYRGRHLLFTEEELTQVVRFAHRLEPAGPALEAGSSVLPPQSNGGLKWQATDEP